MKGDILANFNNIFNIISEIFNPLKKLIFKIKTHKLIITEKIKASPLKMGDWVDFKF